MVSEDPAAVAARKNANEETARNAAIGFGVTLAILAGVSGWNYYQEWRRAIAAIRCKKEEWEM